ncbi:hypothetical protein [Aeromonas veronii]|uniref:hypothetical protein n=1 Tax=Aeromonas veronii TaxID=654 RepID=UPI003BA2C8AA
MKESVNKVRPKDDIQDNTAALELVAETNEELKNSVEKNTLTTDRNTERMQQLEKRLADMNMPVHRFSEDKPEQVQNVRSVIEPINAPVSNPDTPINKPESGEKQPKIEPKIKRKDDSFGMSIANAGKTFAASVVQAGADFGKSMTDQIGSELLPFYSDMKAAASKVTGGAIEAGKLVKSRFERKAEEKKEKRTGSIIPQAAIEKTEKLEKVKELREKIIERKREHADHKLYKKVDDIHDLMRNMMIVNLLKSLVPDFGSFGAAIGRFAGMFAKGGLITAFFLGMKNWAVKFGEASLKGIKSVFTSITSGIKETFTKTVDSIKDGWKKMFPDKPKVDTASPRSKPTINPDTKPDIKPKPMLDKDGKPMLDKSGKPMFEKSVTTIESKTATTLENKAMSSGAKSVAVEAAETGGSKFMKKAGARAVAGTTGGPFGEIIAALLLVKDGLELLLSAFGKKPEDIGKAIDENTSMPEVHTAQTAATGGKLTFTGAAVNADSKAIEQATEQEKQARQVAEQRRTEALAAAVNRGGNNVNTTNVVNKTSSALAPSPFASTATVSAMSQALNNAFKRN